MTISKTGSEANDEVAFAMTDAAGNKGKKQESDMLQVQKTRSLCK